jgi:hypothetical protein
MAEVTYFVALPPMTALTAGEPTECFNPNAALMRAEAAVVSHGRGRP